jgi:hypothetical protein
MNDLPAKTTPGTTVAVAEPQKLDDVLLAMDVVDTLRHREQIAAHEFDADARETQLIERLKEIYGAQGIEVPERILKDGVKALEEQRFVYKPAEGGLNVALAKLYITRKRWMGGAIAGFLALLLVAGGVGFSVMRGNAEWASMPAEIARLSAEGQALAVDPAIDARIVSLENAGTRAVADRDKSAAKRQIAALEDISSQLSLEYNLRVVSRPGEDTGFWRTPDDIPNGRNYYIVVEAVAPDGSVVKAPITSEETQATKTVDMWAQRVTEETFNHIADDKGADQIVQDDILGVKVRGELTPEFRMPVAGGAITEW